MIEIGIHANGPRHKLVEIDIVRLVGLGLRVWGLGFRV